MPFGFKNLFLSLVAISALFSNLASAVPKSPFSEIEISEQCAKDYQAGLQFFEAKMKEGFPFSDREKKLKLFEDFLNLRSEGCRFFASLGLHDAVTFIKKQIVAEYALELHVDPDALPRDRLVEIYSKRIAALGESPEMLREFAAKEELATETYSNIKQTLNEEADKKNTAVPFGRFVFLGSGIVERTLFDYDIDGFGEFRLDQNGQIKMKPGSYQRLARQHFERTREHVQEYIDWRPGIFFSKDSFWYGSIRRYFTKNPEPSLREVKEQGFFKIMRMHMKSAEQFRLNVDQYRKMYKLMLDKQKAVLERDLHAYDTVDRYKWAALFVPVGMYVGASAMVATGWMAAVPSGSTALYLGGSFAYAANVSALVSLSAISGFAGLGAYHSYNAYQSARREGRRFRLTDALDIMALATLQSFPLAAVAPVVVGGSLLAGKTAFLSGRGLLLRSISMGKQAYKIGLGGTLRQVGSLAIQLPGKLVRMPRFVFKMWLQAWYKNPKLLLTHYGVDIAFTVVFECSYRQIHMQGSGKCFYENDAGKFRLNDQFLYSLGGTIVIGPLSKPIALIKNFGLRWATYRAFGTFSSVLIQLAVSGKIDRDRLVFDGFYGATAGTGVGEIARSVKLSQFVVSKSVPTQALLLILFKAIVEKPLTTPLYVGLQDRYFRGELRPVRDIKALVSEWAMIDISEFDDSDVESALESLRTDQEFLDKLSRDAPELGDED